MKRRFVTIAGICLILAAACMMSGCGEKTEAPAGEKSGASAAAGELKEPVFVKNLISAEDMDVNISYISDKSWEKKVKGIVIPNAPKEVSATVYEDVSEKAGGGLLHTVSWGVAVDPYSETYFEEHPLEFSELKILWDDGTETMADVGHVAIRSFQVGKDLEYTGGGEHREAQGIVFYENLMVNKPVRIIGMKIPYEAQLSGLLDSMTINHVPLGKISKEQPLELSEDEECVVEYLKDTLWENSQPQYGRVFLECQLIYLDQKGKERKAMLHLSISHGLTSEEVQGYLKAQQ